jgi:hypothetical protein
MTVLPSQLDIQEASLRTVLSDLHTCMPAEVVAVRADASNKRQFVDVLPMLQREIISEDGEPRDEALPLLQMVPVAYMQGGGFFLSVPLRVGDVVLLLFAERSLDTWIQNATPGARTPVVPGDLSLHSLQGAIALPLGPAPRAGLLAGVDGSDLVIATAQGAVLARFTSAGFVTFAEGINFVALANLVATELGRLWTALGTHTHAVTGSAPSGGGAITGGLATPAGSQGSAGPVAATKTKAT